jgi:predicted nucleic acid-binding Zn ribbon protein
MPITKNCEHCQAPYTRVPALAKESRFCSRKCCFDWKAISSKADKRLQKICDNCSEPYYALPNIFKRARFCSRECYYASKRTENKPLKTCEQCNKEYYPKSNDRAHNEKQKYCSNQCSTIASSTEKECQKCGALFIVTRLNSGLKYCSVKCTPRGSCSYCGKLVTGKGNKRYCDRSCGAYAKKRIAKFSECHHCKRSFPQKNVDSAKHRKYCSAHCSNLATGETKNCPTCGKDYFAHRLIKNRSYCSSKCVPRKPCPLCGVGITKNQRQFCSLECRNIVKAIKQNHIALCFANTIRLKGSLVCERCGYNVIAGLIIHHKDRNRQNNSLGNLETLCSNCHCIEHYSYALERDRLLETAKKIVKYIDKISFL